MEFIRNLAYSHNGLSLFTGIGERSREASDLYNEINTKHQQDLLVFMDYIFRFVQAGSELSTILGRMPSAVGYQPTLATDMGLIQERIVPTVFGSISVYTSVAQKA